MKRSISILFIAVTTIFLLVFACVPHCHHEGKVCFAIEHCEHSEQEGRGEEGECDPSCIANVLYLSPQSVDETKYRAPAPDSHPDSDDPLFVLSTLLADFCAYLEYLPPAKPRYGEYLVQDASTLQNRLNGLRAPPRFLS